MLSEYGVKTKMKRTIIPAVNTNWHFKSLPIKLSPLQLRIMYPIIAPIMPNKHVEAPALTIVSEGFVRSVKMFPPIPDTM